MLTVRDVLADLDVRLLAGERRLDTPVRWVHISELPDPTPFLSGGELLLTTGMALDSAAGQRAYVTALADHGLAGLGLGTGFAHAEVPAALREAAREREFPLFEVPYELPFIAITEQAFTRLVNEQYALLQRSIAAQERLQRMVLGERGLEAIAGALGKLVGGAVLVYDGRGEPLARAGTGPGAAAERALAGEVRAHARDGDVSAFAPADAALAQRALVLPVGGAEGARLPQAWLAVVKKTSPPTEIDRLILHQAVTVVALELLRQRVAHSTERRLAGDLISAVVGGGLEGAELSRRLEPFGLGGRVAALVVAAVPGARTEAVVAGALDDEAVGGLVAGTGDLVCALLPGYDDDELFDVAQRVTDRVRAALGEHGPPARAVLAGAGRAVPAGRARAAYHEARCALEARELGPRPAGSAANGQATRVATFRDLGSFQLLLSLQDTDALRLYCESLLGPIEAGDGHYGGELVRSLEAFIACNGQWEAAARRLYCHRHTLRYRIRRIEELTGRDLGSARDRIEFWLALRGREIVHTTTERGS
jgi:DNA-binding PucR family transcriptional regulator